MSLTIVKYVGFCVYRRSYLLWPPVIIGLQSCFGDTLLGIRVVCPQNGTAVLMGLNP